MHNLNLIGVGNIKCATMHEFSFCSSALTNTMFLANTECLYSIPSSFPSLGYDGCAATATQVVSWSSVGVTTVRVMSCDVVDSNVCITTIEGDVLLYNPDDEELEVAGTISDGILASCLSPDQEVLALVTGKQTVMLLSSQILPVGGEFNLQQSSFGESEPINVGWGKKETQFHGSVGKQAALSDGDRGGGGGLAVGDDGRPRISWRGDGQMFAVSYVDEAIGGRRIRIADRAGVLQYTSEPVALLEQPLCWKPSGSLIASTQRLPNKYNVVFFEKNGLRHGEFTLPEKINYAVREVVWNNDSRVLAVWHQQIETSGDAEVDCCKDVKEKIHYLQLWTVNNYMWYLKEELTFSGIRSIMWDNEEALKLFVITSENICVFNWSFCVHRSNGYADDDLALVSVINGCKLLVTPFKKCKIAPPISAYEVTFPDQIHSVMYPSYGLQDSNVERKPSSNAMCVLHGCTLTVLQSVDSLDDLDNCDCSVDYRLGRSPNFKVKFPVHKPVLQVDLNELDKQLFKHSTLHNCVWLSNGVMYAIRCDQNTANESLVCINVLDSEIIVKEMSIAHCPFLSLSGFDDYIYLQNVKGEVYQLKHGEESVQPAVDNMGAAVIFSTPCPQMECAAVEGVTCIFGLSTGSRFYIGSKQLSGNCTSFAVHCGHLLLTTTSHKLLMIPLNMRAIYSFADGNVAVAGDRAVERGSKVVIAVPGDCEVVLQMPRGNIETVCPRPLLVHILRRLLDGKHYHASLELMRKHRLDMNLLYDHNPKAFIDSCLEFVQSVDNAVWIDLFVAALGNEDTTETLYSFNYKDKDKDSIILDDGLSKVDRVCIAVREAMIKTDENKFLLPILTSYVKMDNSQMDEALRKVKSLKDMKKSELPISAEEGLRHLLYIADADTLCDVALGTYDFELVMMVFEKSQKDPKEFLPFLNNLKKMEEQYMKYSINIYLKRYRKAFESIKNTDTKHVEECLHVIKKEKLFSVALEEFIAGSPLYTSAAEAYGTYNAGRGYYGEAALLYERAGCLKEALEAYQQQCNWRRVFVMATKLYYDKQRMSDLFYSTLELLKDKKMFVDAAVICKDYLNSEEDAIDCLTLAHCWDDAVRLAYKYNRIDLIETNVLPELMRQFAASMTQVDTISKTFAEHCLRLLAVRERLERDQHDPLGVIGDGTLDDDLDGDSGTVTDTAHSRSARSLTGSHASGRTYRSAKNRKKLERKKHSTKEGSAFEDIGLVTELHGLIVQADKLAQPVGCVVSSLYSFDKDGEAVALQTSLHNLLRMIECKEKLIWPVEVDVESGEGGEPIAFGAHLTTAEMIRLRQCGITSAVNASCPLLWQHRLRLLPPALRHPPQPTRPANWALGFLQSKTI